NVIFENSEDCEAFMKTIKIALPQNFRIIESSPFKADILEIFHEQLFPKLENLFYEDGSPIKAPYSLPWYPENLAYQIDAPRIILNKIEEWKKVKEFLSLGVEN
ncbi:MAG: tRNA (cytosine-5-)-methyltransferase ncl1, partial [Paramarteilia canceri]